MNNNMSSYKLLLLTQIEGKLKQYFGLNVKHPNFKTEYSIFKYHSTIHILLLERMDTPNSVNELQNLRHKIFNGLGKGTAADITDFFVKYGVNYKTVLRGSMSYVFTT